VDAINLAEYVFKRIKAQKDSYKEQLAAGSIKNIEEYRFLIGELTALRALEDDIREALQTATGDNLDD
jgi:hypothetical protein